MTGVGIFDTMNIDTNKLINVFMSQFYATIAGNKAPRTCQGHKTTGIEGHIRGWSKGVEVVGSYNEELDQDEFKVYKTGGSAGDGSKELLAEF